MAAPQAPPEPLSPELAGRLAEFAKACKAATRIVSMYPADTSGDSGGARPHCRGRQAGDLQRTVLDHRAARRAARRRTRVRQARSRRSSNWPTLLHQQLIGELTLLDRLDADGWHAVPVAARQVSGRRARHRRRGQGLGGDRQQGDRAQGNRLRRGAARARRLRRKRDVGSHPRRAEGRRRGARRRGRRPRCRT